ncbi:MAG: hypothetical protein AAF999_13415 [Pseudomonadota bacterium]
MHTIADTKTLVAEGVISQAAARIIESRARSAMVALAINAVLCAGILFATFGLIFWLADALAVAVCGGVFLLAGGLTLNKGHALYSMFGNAAALIGAGMLISGFGIEMADKYEDIAGWVMALVGAGVALCMVLLQRTKSLATPFVTGAILLMAGALHLSGLGLWAEQLSLTGLPMVAFWLYAAMLIALAGWFVDVRLVSALAIVPFAQALDTSTFYFHAAYVFYSPEPTLSILQMSGLIAAMLWVARRGDERVARHARIHVMMAFIVANLCALVGSLWGDVVGETIFGPSRDLLRNGADYTDWRDAVEVYRASALVIHEHVFSVLWALALVAITALAAHKNLRGLFNAAVTFAGIHAYTQVFETFYDEPLAYVVGGFVAIPLAWGMWRLNTWFLGRAAPSNE